MLTKRSPKPRELRYYLCTDVDAPPAPGRSPGYGNIVACCPSHAREHAEVIGMLYCGKDPISAEPEDFDCGCDYCGYEWEDFAD